MYHRFEENKYTSTNIKNDIFIQHLKEINNLGIEIITFEKFESLFFENLKKNESTATKAQLRVLEGPEPRLGPPRIKKIRKALFLARMGPPWLATG